jgi:uncharacterized protein YbaP (TraB family)
MRTGEDFLPKLKMLTAAFGVVGACVSASAQAPSAVRSDEIVVTAQRTGIPVWRVNSPTTTLVLIGSINGVAKDTRWDAAALTETLRKADRVMFPSMTQLSGSPFQLIGMYAKWRKQATLPKGQSLAQLLPPEQFRRLVALQQRGVLKPGFERTHPFHLANALRKHAEGKRGSQSPASEVVRQTVKKFKIKTVPIETARLKTLAGDYFATPAKAYVPCLIDSIALVEAGPGTVKARSDAWAQRRVTDVMRSPANKVWDSCQPPALDNIPRADFRGQVRSLLAQPQLTVAVVELDSLARPGGLLDSLDAAGFDVRGPRWKS